jgi:hypothetical protein
MQKRLSKGYWILLTEIYHMIENGLLLDNEDYEWQSPSSTVPKWKRNVRNVLQYRKNTGDIEWNGQGKYRL